MHIVIADQLPSSAVELLSSVTGWTVDARAGRAPDVLAPDLANADALVVRSATKVDERLLAAAPKLRVIARAGTGIDNVDLAAASARGILVMNAPGGNSVSVAEHALALMLSLARSVPTADATMKRGVWDKKKLTGAELRGKTLGLCGLGRIGQEVAARGARVRHGYCRARPVHLRDRRGLARHPAAQPRRHVRGRRLHQPPSSRDDRDASPLRRDAPGEVQARDADRQHRARRAHRRERAGRRHRIGPRRGRGARRLRGRAAEGLAAGTAPAGRRDPAHRGLDGRGAGAGRPRNRGGRPRLPDAGRHPQRGQLPRHRGRRDAPPAAVPHAGRAVGRPGRAARRRTHQRASASGSTARSSAPTAASS